MLTLGLGFALDAYPIAMLLVVNAHQRRTEHVHMRAIKRAPENRSHSVVTTDHYFSVTPKVIAKYGRR